MIIDRVAESLGRRLLEVPVGFKWFVPGLLDGSVAFGGEESAGASFLRFDGSVWSTDKDGILLCLLAAEIIAVTGKSPSERYAELETAFGSSAYQRVDAPATPEQKATLAKLAPESVSATTLAGEEITAKLSHAPGNGAAIGGLKVQTEHAWFAARPSGTEDVYKLYAEPARPRAPRRGAGRGTRGGVSGAGGVALSGPWYSNARPATSGRPTSPAPRPRHPLGPRSRRPARRPRGRRGPGSPAGSW